MKLACLFLLAALTTAAQTNVTLVTNYVAAHPDLRIVDGKLYNRSKSRLWEDFRGECLQVRKDGVLLQEEFRSVGHYAPPDVGEPQGTDLAPTSAAPRRLLWEEKKSARKFFVRNYPRELQPKVGERISGRAMRFGTIEIDRETFTCLDYGTPHSVPVVSKKK